jgi:hypothetical protein
MATLYVHCGLHKTGTTALQRVLASHDENLAGGGFYVPKAGRFGPATGHHNLAWELTRDRRYDPRRGGLAALRTELLEVAGDVIVSSEDFESLLHRPAALAPLVKLAQDTGRTVTWVVYLREQVAYLGALYLQCLKAGFGEEYSSFVHEVLSRRAIQRWEWTFQFDYGGVLEHLSALETCGVLVRSYHELVGGSTVSDFFSALNIPLDLAPSDALSLRTHERNALNVSLQSSSGTACNVTCPRWKSPSPTPWRPSSAPRRPQAGPRRGCARLSPLRTSR